MNHSPSSLARTFSLTISLSEGVVYQAYTDELVKEVEMSYAKDGAFGTTSYPFAEPRHPVSSGVVPFGLLIKPVFCD